MQPVALGYPAFVVVLPFAVAAGVVVPVALAKQRRVSWQPLLLFLVLVGVAALGGAKLYSMFERGSVGQLGNEIGAGFRYPGGILALLVAVPFLRVVLPKGIALASVLDLMAPGIGVAMAVMRVHCLLSGCCTGFPCMQPWCLAYPHGSPVFEHQASLGLLPFDGVASLPVHVLPVYFMLASLGSALFAIWFLSRAAYPGQTFLVFQAMHESVKFGLEFLRDPAAPLAQGGSLLLAAGAVGTLAIVRLRRHADAGNALAAKPAQVREGT